jgi:hypothetical protein
VKPSPGGFIPQEVMIILLPVGMFPREIDRMFNRRSVLVGGLAMATAPSLARIAQAQSGKPMLVFVGHEQ